MAVIANNFVSGYRLAWFRREFAPFPGREITTLRIVVTVLIVVITSMALQVPQLFLSAFFVFFVTKENRTLTTFTGAIMLAGSTIAVGSSLFLYRYTFDYPELRVPVMAGMIFMGMFLSRVFFIGPLGFVVGFFAALTQTTVELAPNTEALVRGTLWLWVALNYPIVLTVIINQILLPAHPWDALVRELKNRLRAASATLRQALDEDAVGGQNNLELLHRATRGVSALRTMLGYAETVDPALKSRHAALCSVIAASEHLATVTAALAFRSRVALAPEDRQCAEAMLVELERLQNGLTKTRPTLPAFNAAGVVPPLAHFRDLESALRDFHTSLGGRGLADTSATAEPAKKPLFIADAFTNPNHVRFALKVTLAAMTCYLLYTALDWPGISTCIATCCFIALGNTGATIRKAWLRLIGCCTGGLLGALCIGFVVPRMESIVSLVLLIGVATAAAAWIATGSDRISYAGLQGAFAFYMCLFQGFAPGTNFTTIRDRVAGILLGIVVASAVFRHIWPEYAADALRRTLAQVLRRLAQLMRLPKTEAPAAAARAELDKALGEITRGLDNALHFSEVVIYEQPNRRVAAGFSTARLERMVADTQTLSLMTTVLLGKTKLEEWEQLGERTRRAEEALRARAAEQVERVAAAVECGAVPQPENLHHAFMEWHKTVPEFTQNDRPRLIRRLVEQIRELSAGTAAESPGQ